MAQAKRKKKFFEIEIPIVNKPTQLQAYEIEELEGRFIKYDLTRMLKGKSIMFTGKIILEENKPRVISKKIVLMPYFIRRMMRKGTNYVEDSFDAECKNSELKIKPFLITRRKVSRAVRKALREKAREELIGYVKDKTSDELFEEVIRNQLQKPLSLKLKKIYPLALCEIRILEVKNKE